MDALRARLLRRAALRRALPAEEVDEMAARNFWRSLSLDERLDVLRFEDAALVQRMHSHMTSVCKSELWCRRNVMGGLVRDDGSSGQVERLKGFAFECPAESDCMGRRPAPTTFCATPDIAGSDTIFEDLKKSLGSALLEGRPVLLRQDWASVAETTPGSWPELQLQALRLVELAIFQAQRDAAAEAASAAAAAAAAKAEAELQAGVAPASPSKDQRSKKKGKKNKSSATRRADATDASQIGAVCLSEPTCGEDPDASLEAEHPDGCNLEEELVEEEHEEEGEEQEEVEEGGEVEALIAAVVGEDEVRAETEIEPGSNGKAFIASGCGEGTSSQTSAPRSWTAWLRSVAREDTAEWRWVIFQPSPDACSSADGGADSPHPGFCQPSPAGVRAVVKNTFLDLEHDCGKPDQQPFRKSCYF